MSCRSSCCALKKACNGASSDSRIIDCCNLHIVLQRLQVKKGTCNKEIKLSLHTNVNFCRGIVCSNCWLHRRLWYSTFCWFAHLVLSFWVARLILGKEGCCR